MLKGWPFSLQKQHELVEAYSRLFASSDGQIVLADILDQAQAFEATPPDGPSVFNDGKRAVAFDILRKASVSSDLRAELAKATYLKQEEDTQNE
ncbi:hypothetical protein [Kiloniella majae]|uniref:Bbp19 family protein n=1 Tax=Kiloniella majae TaxID=1938558 RepID=UPI000A276EC1|nr:hypothetical protein [Kiloniella majae]